MVTGRQVVPQGVGCKTMCRVYIRVSHVRFWVGPTLGEGAAAGGGGKGWLCEGAVIVKGCRAL